MPKYQATAYIRLSYTDDRSSESDSVTNQRKLIENFIERNPDIQIVSEKIDDGYSGIILFAGLFFCWSLRLEIRCTRKQQMIRSSIMPLT